MLNAKGELKAEQRVLDHVEEEHEDEHDIDGIDPLLPLGKDD